MKKLRANDLHLRPANQSIKSDPTLSKRTIVELAVSVSPAKSTLLNAALPPTGCLHFAMFFFRPQLYQISRTQPEMAYVALGRIHVEFLVQCLNSAFFRK